MATFQEPKRYPRINKFLTERLPLIPETKPKVFNHFTDYSGMMPKDAKDLLRPGFVPRIEVKDIFKAAGQRNKYGWTPTDRSGEIWLNKGFLNNCKSLLAGDTEIVSGPYDHYKDKEFTERFIVPRLFLQIEVTVLHELVHFGRKLMNGYSPDTDTEERIAQIFEIKAYGFVHRVTELGIQRYIPEPK